MGRLEGRKEGRKEKSGDRKIYKGWWCACELFGLEIDLCFKETKSPVNLIEC